MYCEYVIEWIYVCYKIWKINKKSGILTTNLKKMQSLLLGSVIERIKARIASKSLPLKVLGMGNRTCSVHTRFSILFASVFYLSMFTPTVWVGEGGGGNRRGALNGNNKEPRALHFIFPLTLFAAHARIDTLLWVNLFIREYLVYFQLEHKPLS